MISVIYPLKEGNILLFEDKGVKKIFRDGDEITLTLQHRGTSLIFKLTAVMISCTEYFLQCETDEDIYKIYLHGFEVLDIIKRNEE